jgi:hypothetical protein
MSQQPQPGINDDAPLDAMRDEMMTEIFAHMVIQNTNMALMFLGQVPHPQSGQRVHDLEAAKMFIDQLEMLEAKTTGNLNPEEQKLLQQSLMHLRMTFVKAVENPPKAEPAKAPEAPAATPAQPESSAPAAEPGSAESGKRFSKKF